MEYNISVNCNKNGKAYLLRGNLQLLLGDVDAACSDYDMAIKYRGQELNMYLYAYEQLEAMGYLEQGQLYLRRAVEAKGKTAQFYRQKGQAYILLGEYSNAKEQLSMAQNLGDEESKLYMAKVMELEGNFDGAKSIYENYAKTHANDAYACESLAKVLLEQGHYEDALRYIQQAKNIGNISDEASLLKCEVICYEKIGEFQKAKERMEEYMQKYPLDAAAQKELIFLNSR
jgi:tetratricopeptide (TPR) repeat protein